MSESSHLALKVVVIVHFILSVWGSMFFLTGTSYMYMNAFVLAFGIWAIISPESVDAVLMFFIMDVISIVLDAVFIGVFASMSPNAEHSLAGNTYRFCLGMSILNLILKPFTSFILYRNYQERRGETAFPTFGFMEPGHRSEYQPIGTSASAPYRPTYVETAAPHSTIEKNPSS